MQDKRTKKQFLEELSTLHQQIDNLKKSMTLFGPEEDVLKVIGNSLQVGIYIIQDGKTIFANAHISLYSGYSQEELLNISLMQDTVHPKDQARVRECGIKMLRGEDLAPYEYRILCKDGSIKWLMEKVTSIKYRGQRAILGNTMDVTDKKRTEDELRDIKTKLEIRVQERTSALLATNEALKESEERYRNVFENHVAVKFLIDPDTGSIIEANEAAVNYYGWSHERLKQMKIQEINTLPPEDVKEEMEKARTKKRITFEFRHRRADGSIRDVEVFSSKIEVKGKVLLHSIVHDITERKRAEGALREGEQRLHSIIDGSPTPAFVIGKDHRVIHWNKALEEMSRIKHEEVLGTREHWKAFYKEERPCMADLLVEDLLDAIPQWYSGKYIKSKLIEGAYEATDFFPELGNGGKWLRFTAAIIRDSQEDLVGAVETLEDITERKKAEEALKSQTEELRKSHKFIESVLENMPDMIFVKDAKNLRFVRFNKAGEALLGYSRDELLGKGDHDFFPAQEADFFTSIDRETLASGKMIEIQEEPIQTKYHGLRWLHTRKIPILDEERKPEYLLGISSDITDRKRAEEALRESQQQLADIISFLPDATLVINNEGKVIAWNRALEAMTGVMAEEMLGKGNYEYALPFYGERRPILIDLALLCDSEREKEYTAIRRIGDTIFGEAYTPNLSPGNIHLSATASVLRDYRGEIIAAIECIRNNTERKILEAQLQQAQKMESIGTLAGGIAHDFNNILSAIMGYTDMALVEHKADDHLRRYLEQVFKAGERARDLVKQILAFSRQSDEKPRPLRVSPIIKEVLKLLRASLPSTIHIHQDIQCESDTVLADPTQIHQILMNLCTNAAHAMRETKGELKVSLVPVEIKPGDTLIIHHDLSPGMYLKLTVNDTGAGIAPEIIDRIFDPFFTTKKPREGTGMGLSVVYGIVKGYNGAITVESEPGKGTGFQVYLPLLKETKSEEEIDKTISIVGGEERILFVDDEENLVQLGKDMLTGLGYEVVGRTSSVEALEVFRVRPRYFDLVITDMTMPNMTGVDLAKEMLMIRPDVPIILCTGFSEIISEEKAKKIGIRRFLMKPLLKSSLAMMIREVLDTR